MSTADPAARPEDGNDAAARLRPRGEGEGADRAQQVRGLGGQRETGGTERGVRVLGRGGDVGRHREHPGAVDAGGGEVGGACGVDKQGERLGRVAGELGGVGGVDDLAPGGGGDVDGLGVGGGVGDGDNDRGLRVSHAPSVQRRNIRINTQPFSCG